MKQVVIKSSTYVNIKENNEKDPKFKIKNSFAKAYAPIGLKRFL